MMIIGKKLDGTQTYRGAVFDILDYIAEALDIRYSHLLILKYEIVLEFLYQLTFI